MNRIQKTLFIGILIILGASRYPIFAQNLLANPGFEEGGGGSLSGWIFWAYTPQDATHSKAAGISHTGSNSALVECIQEDDARLIQTVNVKADTTYKISGWIRTENIGAQNLGANLSIEKSQFYSRDIKGTNPGWEYVELYVKTGKDTSSMNVCAGIGGYGSTNTGKAYFDDLSLEEAADVPASARVAGFEASSQQQESTGTQESRSGPPRLQLQAGEFAVMLVWMGIALLALIIFLILIAKKPALFIAVYGSLINLVSHVYVPPKDEYKGLRRITGSPYTRPLFFLVAFAILGLPFVWDIGRSIAVDPVSLNVKHYVYLAKSMLEGRLDSPVYQDDIAVFQGKNWVIYPPFPVIFLLPFVAIFGENTNLVPIGLALALFSVILLWKITRKIDADPKSRPWVLFAFVFGTGYWLCLRNTAGVAWYAHVASVLPLMLALNESLGKSRGILTGLFIGCAFLSRQFCIFLFPFLLAATWLNSSRKTTGDRIVQSGLFCIGLAVCVAVYFWYNQVRFGNPFDTGYAYLRLGGSLDEKVRIHGLFSTTFFPFNAVYMFLQGFHINYGEWPASVTDVHKYWPIDPYGTSIIAASPFIFFALKAKWDKRLLISMWASIIIIAAGGLFYYNNGWVQYNAQRFAVDFLPALMILIALGIKHVPQQYWKPLVVYAVFLNAVTMLIIPTAG